VRFGAGRLAADAAVEAALGDAECAVFDWMRGEEPYKFSLSDHTDRTVDLFASSSTLAWWLASAVRAARRRARDLTAEHERLAQAWRRIEPQLRRIGRMAQPGTQ